MLHDGYFYSFSIAPILTFALRVTPKGGVGLTLLLTVAALALGCGIALLSRAELTHLSGRSRRPDTRPITNPPEDEGASLPEARRAPLLRARTYLLSEGERAASACAVICDDPPSELTEPETPEPTPVEYAEGTAECAQDSCDESYQPREAASGVIRAEVNLDVIARKFRDGELVDLDALKRKRLVPRRTEHVKILARGTLTKPLVVEAHDFSRSAEEMLRAAGGEAIRVS